MLHSSLSETIFELDIRFHRSTSGWARCTTSQTAKNILGHTLNSLSVAQLYILCVLLRLLDDPLFSSLRLSTSSCIIETAVSSLPLTSNVPSSNADYSGLAPRTKSVSTSSMICLDKPFLTSPSYLVSKVPLTQSAINTFTNSEVSLFHCPTSHRRCHHFLLDTTHSRLPSHGVRCTISGQQWACTVTTFSI